MRSRIIRFALLLAGIFLLAGYAPVPAAAQTTAGDLAGTSWTLSSLNGQLPLPGTTVTMEFGTDGSVTGSDGCNRFNTTYTTNGSTIRIRPLGASTMMACPEPVAAQATAFMQALVLADTYEVRSNVLTLFDGGQIVATFIETRQELGGTQWQVLAYNNGREAVVSVQIGTELTASFQDDGVLLGNAGCNDYFADYTTDNGAISIGEIGTTFRACATPLGVMEQEAQFLAALGTAATYRIEGNFLELRDANDAIAVQMARNIEVVIPEPEAGVPTGRVTAPNGVNIRSGPGTNFPILATARFGAEGEIVGRSVDGRWWVVAVPSAPGGSGWVSADFVAVTDADDVPVIASPPPPVFVPPPTPTPAPTPTRPPAPTATPAPQLSFSASPTTIDQGQCSTLRWSVENVQAVWVYPQGRPYQQYPRVGQGEERVCPPVTTTYEMRVLQRDGSVTFQRVTVNVRPAAVQNPLPGTAWQVTGYYTGQGAVVSPISGTTLTVRFDNSSISGNAGCNSFNGSYSVSGTNISISNFSTSMSLCDTPTGIMEQEADFLRALQSSTSFQFDADRLTLRRGDGTVTVFMSRMQ